MFRPITHEHPRNPDETQFGQELEPHEIVESDDVYPDTSGVWRKCGQPYAGYVAKDLSTLGPIIRPVP